MNPGDGIKVGDIDVSGNQMTVEAVFTRTVAYTGGYLYAGNIVSKHDDPSNINYLLRPSSAEITTSNGYFATPQVCDIQLNRTYHVAMVYDGSTLKFYRNGYLMSEVAATGDLYQNDFITTIGEKAFGSPPLAENLKGYINEVRIWSVARTQQQIRDNMTGSLANPSAQAGLRSYYTFDNLLNKQGNTLFNGTLSGGAAISRTNPACNNFVIDSCNIIPTPTLAIPDFTIPSSVCANEPVTITNNSIGASKYYWNFCAANLSSIPAAQNLGNLGGYLQGPVFMDYALDNGNYYGFVVNNFPGGLVRLDFGNSLLNTPVAVNLGDFGGAIPNSAEGIQVVKNEGKWYAIIVGGTQAAGQSRVVKISFGTALNNATPTATNWGNSYGLSFPIDLHLFQDGNRWYGFTINSANNTLTRFDFTESFENTPTGSTVPLPSAFDYPTGIYTMFSNGNWYSFITNESPSAGSPTLIRLDFGSSLLNVPVPVNLGNPGNALTRPRDISVFNYCGNVSAFVVNAITNELVRIDFGDNLLNAPSGTKIGNIGGLNFPHSISKIFRQGGDVYCFTTNVSNNTITRFKFEGCNNPDLPGTSDITPQNLIYNTPGTYNISLTVDEGLPTQASICKQIIVKPEAAPEFSFIQDVCDPALIHFKNESSNYTTLTWDFGNGRTETNTDAPDVTYNPFGTYTVQLKADLQNGCSKTISKEVPVVLLRDSLIINRDSVYCFEKPVQLNALPALSYCWTPATGLSDPNIANPVINTPVPQTTYYLNALMPIGNLVNNPGFTNGNNSFTSDYNFNPGSGVNEGVYTVSANVPAWHPSFANCGDHTNGTGNMLLVNGSGTANARVWSQTIPIQPNTNYAFSAWIQTLVPSNPAQLQFSINGVQLGTTISANAATCRWDQFYAVWNSGNSSSAVISIVNINLNTGGNDFALDDISFAPLQMVRDSVTITVHETPDVDFSFSVPYCKSPQFKATALAEPSPIGTWKWVFDDGTEGISSAVTHSYAKGGEYDVKLIATDGNGCMDSVVHVVKLDTATAMVSDGALVCKGSTVSFQASGGVSYSWWPAAALSDAGLPVQQAVVDTSTRFVVTVTDALSCTDTASVLMAVIPRPDFVRPPNRDVCADSTVTMLGANDDAFTYQWSPASAFNNASLKDPVVKPIASTQYEVLITEGTCGYDTSFTVGVRVNPNPTVKASSSNDINCLNTTTFLSAVSEAGTRFEWSPASAVDNPAGATRVVGSLTQPGYFTVKSTNQYGCSAYDSVLVNVTTDGPTGFQVPNAFTPNGDGINDCISLNRWGSVQLHEFSIYTRWGERVFSSNDPRRCWDGTFKGKALPVGAYVYFIRAKGLCGDITRKGQIMLVR
ncbi:PKD domain-containing protein [Parasegetibacter sp. NRK P23]|uniref:PKD domain-containing protein n=1 Tax=Parasegetibacter sp. NRK P23 TaxID=2942999 RepID=UPI002044C96C|nr:PKD domain-containing protein [Parasegetibacter sp. NRK P23]MCM5528539.1 PKD domain-containing protein [Parasegetibacter sp. NRK P23]